MDELNTNIISYKIDENRLINFSNPKETAYSFKKFTNKYKKLKKVFVSYNHTDFGPWRELTEYLISLFVIKKWRLGLMVQNYKVVMQRKEEIIKKS
jgi:hypothetical protein